MDFGSVGKPSRTGVVELNDSDALYHYKSVIVDVAIIKSDSS